VEVDKLPKRISDEEKQLRAWKKDEELIYILECKCGQRHQIAGIVPLDWTCKNGCKIIKNKKIDEKCCRVVYQREENDC
jgi:hypothetical protein